MDSSSNPALALLGFWMLLQLVAFLALLWGGIYFLFCLNRASSSLDRLATAAERWVEQQNKPLPGQRLPVVRESLPPTVPVPAGSAPSVLGESAVPAAPAWYSPETEVRTAPDPDGPVGGAVN